MDPDSVNINLAVAYPKKYDDPEDVEMVLPPVSVHVMMDVVPDGPPQRIHLTYRDIVALKRGARLTMSLLTPQDSPASTCCSWCGGQPTPDRDVVQGPGVRICVDCVALVTEVIEQKDK